MHSFLFHKMFLKTANSKEKNFLQNSSSAFLFPTTWKGVYTPSMGFHGFFFNIMVFGNMGFLITSEMCIKRLTCIWFVVDEPVFVCGFCGECVGSLTRRLFRH